MGSLGLGPAALASAVEGLCMGLREPAALAPDCVWTVVRGLKVTVRCGRGAGVFLEVEARLDEECVGSSGEDSSTDVAMLTRAGWIRCTGRKMLISDDHAPGDFLLVVVLGWIGRGLRLMVVGYSMTPAAANASSELRPRACMPACAPLRPNSTSTSRSLLHEHSFPALTIMLGA